MEAEIQIDEYILNSKWKEELTILRKLLLASELVEQWKWSQPCYTFEGKNVAIIGAFKDHCVLSFFKGLLIHDTKDLLMPPGKNTQSAMILRIDDVKYISANEKYIKDYINQAIDIEKRGLKVVKKTELEYPEELIQKFKVDSAFETAFKALTPGRQRGFILHITGSKKPETRNARIEKHTERIFAGKGIHDCICGHSNRMPRCDGSHNKVKN